VEEVAVKPHVVMTERTAALESAFYDLLARCDEYRSAVDELLAMERSAESPRDQLIHRLEQMSARITRIIGILEDDALTELLPVLDRLFTLARAERGDDV
jgi:hypothetical protein